MGREGGFTLTELAVVLVIVALLIGGLVVPLTAQIDIRDSSDTRRAMAEIREALFGFAVVNGRLPCPALPTTASTVAGAGQEGARNGDGSCVHAAGVLPWWTLNLNETDAWGRRYTYRVSPAFTRNSPPPDNNECPSPRPPPPFSPNAGFALCSLGDISVVSSASGATGIALNLPAIVISHGKNGRGAYMPQGTQLPAGADADELDNQLVSAGAPGIWTDVGVARRFVKRSPTATYDDEVVWISPSILSSRMIAAGKLP